MDAPYRSEDPVAKLQDENEKLRQENDRLMWRFSALRKWPAYLFFGLMVGVVTFGSFYAGTSVSSPTSENGSISSFDYHRLDYQERRLIAAEVAQKLTPALASHTHSTSPSRACPAPPICANGADERVLGMNKVVNGTIGGPETGPRSEDWKFSARAGDEVIFRMKKKSGNLYSFLVLTDLQGNILGNVNDVRAWPNATLRHRFVSDGVYVVRCMERKGYMNEGSYTLSASRVRTR